MAFHEKAGRSQVDSSLASLNKVFCSPAEWPLSPCFHPHSRGAIGALGQAGRTAPGFSTMAEKHHPGEIGPPKTCESLPVSCYVSPNLLENNEVRILDSHSALALGLQHWLKEHKPYRLLPERAPSEQTAGDSEHDSVSTTHNRHESGPPLNHCFSKR